MLINTYSLLLLVLNIYILNLSTFLLEKVKFLFVCKMHKNLTLYDLVVEGVPICVKLHDVLIVLGSKQVYGGASCKQLLTNYMDLRSIKSYLKFLKAVVLSSKALFFRRQICLM